MGKADGKVTRWMITWETPHSGIFQTPCALTEGYTTWNNVPQMIAIKRSLKVEQIKILAMVRINDDEGAELQAKNIVWCMVCGTGFPSIPASMSHEHFEV